MSMYSREANKWDPSNCKIPFKSRTESPTEVSRIVRRLIGCICNISIAITVSNEYDKCTCNSISLAGMFYEQIDGRIINEIIAL